MLLIYSQILTLAPQIDKANMKNVKLLSLGDRYINIHYVNLSILIQV